MSKINLKRLLKCSEIPQILIYFDKWDVCGRNLIWSSTKSHLTQGRAVYYLCYSVSISECSPLLKYDPGGKLRFYDLYTDPLGWKSNSNQHLDAKQNFSDLIQLSKTSSEEKFVVIIDSLDSASKYLSEAEILRDLLHLKNVNSVFQVIILCHEDTTQSAYISALKNVAPCNVTLKTSNPLNCHILLKKKSGKVLQSVEDFSISSEFDLEYCQKLSEDTGVGHEPNSSEVPFETTFNLSLTPSQQEAKNKLILPHTRIQLSGGRIHYVPEAEDDWDDEDPDDDLGI